jgi:hypothetical protein
MVAQIKALAEQVGEQLDAHADAHIFTSLPRSVHRWEVRRLAAERHRAPNSERTGRASRWRPARRC